MITVVLVVWATSVALSVSHARFEKAKNYSESKETFFHHTKVGRCK